MRRWTLLYGALASALLVTTGFADDRRTIIVDTPRGVKQSFLFASPVQPKAAAILFIGGDGVLGLKPSDRGDTNSKNFLIRIFDDLVHAGVMTAAVDVPADKKTANLRYRVGGQQAADTSAVIAYLRSKAEVPVWLIGTSMGTFSATNAAIRDAGQVAGLILTSTITVPHKGKRESAEFPHGVADMDLPSLRVPVLILAHEQDGCASSPPGGVEALSIRLTASLRVKVAMIAGGKRPKSGPCEPLSQHGYFGVEDKAVRAITTFMLR